MKSPSVPATKPAPVSCRRLWLLLLAAAAVPVSLLWDFSWESTVGIDRFWAPAHTLTYLAVGLAGVAALALAMTATRRHDPAVRFGRCQAPLGAWLALWGGLAFGTAMIFDRWWQSAYGLSAGIWHPPQLLKTVAFFAVLGGAWLVCLARQNQSKDDATANALLFSAVGGLVLVLITLITITATYPNRQHSASFFKLTGAFYPIVLVALARAGKLRWSATVGAVGYLFFMGAMVWLLPLFPAHPQVGPIYNPLDHLMPPPFPLLLFVPALALDWVLKKFRWPALPGVTWLQAVALGLAFFVCFLFAQWAFAEFLLTKSADHWFFAGGGRHWPFFLKISPAARVQFWDARMDPLNLSNALIALGFSLLAARGGLWLGAWMSRVRR